MKWNQQVVVRLQWNHSTKIIFQFFSLARSIWSKCPARDFFLLADCLLVSWQCGIFHVLKREKVASSLLCFFVVYVRLCLDGATRRQKSKIQNLNCTNVGERRVKEMFFQFFKVLLHLILGCHVWWDIQMRPTTATTFHGKSKRNMKSNHILVLRITHDDETSLNFSSSKKKKSNFFHLGFIFRMKS